MTTAKKKDDPRKHNLQIQVNRRCKISTLKKLAPDTVADALIPEDSDMTGEEIKAALLAGLKV